MATYLSCSEAHGEGRPLFFRNHRERKFFVDKYKMGKNNNPELKKKDAVKGVSKKKSKNVVKNITKKLRKPIYKEARISVNPVNGKDILDTVVKVKKNKQPPQKNKKDDTASNTMNEKDLAKIEKKRAKKLAQKLKKKQKRETRNMEDSKESKTDDTNYEKSKEFAKEVTKVQNKEGTNDVDTSKAKEGIKNRNESNSIKGAATIFIGNLPVNTKRVQLKRLFTDYGPINGIRVRSATGKVLYKHKDRKEAGTLNAWVVLKDADTAKRALSLNGIVFKNNHLRVMPADLKVQIGNSLDIKRTIFVGNLKYSATEEKLREIFSSCGDVDYVRCLHDGEKGCKGVAYVCFKAPEAVGLALELNETMLDERPIHVERYSAKKLTTNPTRTGNGISKISSNSEKMPKRIKGDTLRTKKVDQGGKKPKFRGVKVGGMSKKYKKVKVTNQMQELAKKIAPKLKS